MSIFRNRNMDEHDEDAIGRAPVRFDKAVDAGPPAAAPSNEGFRRRPAIAAEKCENVLGAGARFKGRLQVQDSVRVEGQFEGELHTGATLEVAAGARLNGSVAASFVTIAGAFQGQIRCQEQTELLPGSKVRADIVTRRLSIQDGATFDGDIHMETK